MQHLNAPISVAVAVTAAIAVAIAVADLQMPQLFH